MVGSRRLWIVIFFAAAIGIVAPSGFAQQGTAPAQPDRSKYRKLAPGILTTIPLDKHEEETSSQHDIVEILKGVPNLDWQPHSASDAQTLKSLSTQTLFHRDVVWNLEFSFLPMSMIWVDVPQAGGRMERKLIYYLAYRVRNTGRHLQPVKQPDGTYKIQEVDMDVFFMPLFSLETVDGKKAYLDRLLPTAVAPIQQREDPNRKLLNSVEISAKGIPVSHEGEDKSVWGVATWSEIDPSLDFFSVVVEGLSNAHRWVDPPGGFKAGDAPGTGRKLAHKVLQLNFYRPGDDILPDERTIYFGIPGKIDSEWFYR